MIKEVQMEEKDVLEQEEKRAKLCIALNECVLESDFDRDSAHRKADILLIDYIGDEEVREIYDEIGKWYS
jgi:hypothetical protein